MKHEFKVTTNGNAAVIACMALSRPPRITRVAFGAGLVPEGTDLADMHAPVAPVADGAVLDVQHAGNRLSFTVQYANVNHPDIEDFPLSEYLVYIIDPETGEETDYLYGTLGDYRQPMPQYQAGAGACVFSYPLEVILSGALEVHVDAPADLSTWLDLERHNLAADAHPDLREAVARAQAAAEQGPYYKEFEADAWSGGALRIPRSEHGMTPARKACMYQLRQRVDKNGRSILASNTWSVLEARVYWDLNTGDLVVEHDTPFAGDLFVQGGCGSGVGFDWLTFLQQDRTLTPRQRELLLLALSMHPKDQAELADKLGLDKSTVSRTLKRAKQSLRLLEVPQKAPVSRPVIQDWEGADRSALAVQTGMGLGFAYRYCSHGEKIGGLTRWQYELKRRMDAGQTAPETAEELGIQEKNVRAAWSRLRRLERAGT